MASVCKACEGRVVSGVDRASLLKHNMGCLHTWEPEEENETWAKAIADRSNLFIWPYLKNRFIFIFFAMPVKNLSAGYVVQY